jgi:hypothetical protein
VSHPTPRRVRRTLAQAPLAARLPC